MFTMPLPPPPPSHAPTNQAPHSVTHHRQRRAALKPSNKLAVWLRSSRATSSVSGPPPRSGQAASSRPKVVACQQSFNSMHTQQATYRSIQCIINMPHTNDYRYLHTNRPFFNAHEIFPTLWFPKLQQTNRMITHHFLYRHRHLIRQVIKTG